MNQKNVKNRKIKRLFVSVITLFYFKIYKYKNKIKSLKQKLDSSSFNHYLSL